MIKNIIASALAGLALCAPGQARIESGTSDLINLIDDNGIVVRVDTEECTSGEYLGLYRHRGMARAFILCPGSDVDANDHMVVRHEAVHVIQHCVNAARDTSVYTPIINDDEKLMEWVRMHLTEEMIAEIKKLYPRSHWKIEYEAFAGMYAYSADELADLFRKACLYSDD